MTRQAQASDPDGPPEGFGPIYPSPGSAALDDIERPVAGGLLEVPWRVRTKGIWLEYESADLERFHRQPWMPSSVREAMNRKEMRQRGWWHYRAPSGRLLKHFQEIASAPNERSAAEQIEGFADRYGVLDLCPEHRLPASHNPGMRDFNRNDLPACDPHDWSTLRGRERVEDWVRFARLARIVTIIATRLHGGSKGKSEEWREVIRLAPTLNFDERDLSKSAKGDWFHLRWVLNAWLDVSGIGFALLEVGRNPLLLRIEATQRWGRLFGALGLQLVLRVSGSRGIAICSECQEPYDPRRRIDSTRDNFCPKHRRVALKRAKDRDRAAQRDTLAAHRAGKSPKDIARRLGTSVARVRRVIRAGRVT